MVMQSSAKAPSNNSVLAKLGRALDQSVAKHARDETTYGIIRLPGGINNGIAQLISCTFGEYKTGTYQGKAFFRAAGVVISPKTVATPDGVVKVAGQQTSIMEPICDTKTAEGKVTTQDEHIERVMNHMRMLGGPRFTESAQTVMDLSGLCKVLEELGPYFRFTTSTSAATKDPKTGKMRDPRVWENWHGTEGLEDYDPAADGEPALEDDSTGVIADDGEVAAPPPPVPPQRRPSPAQGNGAVVAKPVNRMANVPATAARSAPRRPAPPPPELEPLTPATGDDFGDLDSLAEQAENGSDDAQQRLIDMAEQAGIDAAVIQATEPWSALVELIVAAGGEEAAPEEAAVANGPAVGEVCLYKPVDPRTKKPGKAVECEVKAVDATTQTVTLGNLATPKVVYRAVAWDQLIYS